MMTAQSIREFFVSHLSRPARPTDVVSAWDERVSYSETERSTEAIDARWQGRRIAEAVWTIGHRGPDAVAVREFASGCASLGVPMAVSLGFLERVMAQYREQLSLIADIG